MKHDNQRNITILDNSILKDIKPHEIKISASESDIYIKSFSGATTQCMQDYVNPSLKHKPDLIILHCGTNDLRSKKKRGGYC